ncbi:MAG: hypothetical protein DBY04_03875 [Clostridiales bacterium]|nr:MAG: hypothetical protein DBY04_03875 [Clostridiales bacterium]
MVLPMEKNSFICDFGDCHFQNHYVKETHSGTEYLFMEWKSGDYHCGGFGTDYDVFTRKEAFSSRKESLDVLPLIPHIKTRPVLIPVLFL